VQSHQVPHQGRRLEQYPQGFVFHILPYSEIPRLSLHTDLPCFHTDFDTLNDQMDKASALIKAEGVPVFYFQTVLAIDNAAKNVHLGSIAPFLSALFF
jgi:hypothetical protein